MTRLVNQPSAMPTRKLLAAALTGAIVAFGQVIVDAYFPGVSLEQLGPFVDQAVLYVTMLVSAYMTKNKAV